MIKADHLSKQYGTNIALYNANFHIAKGELVGFLGPNGAGKSTTMNLLCGYIEPTWGQVEIAGVNMADNPLEARKHIGYLPEIPPLYMDMTVEEQLIFACEMRGLPYKKNVQKDYIASLCQRTEMLDVRHRQIRNLSKGYRQRVGVTQLLVGEPEVLVLDEPTVGLDPRQTHEFRDLLVDLGKSHTIILSSHILSEIRSICSRILVFDNGELIADGQPDYLQEKLSGQRITIAEIEGDRESIVQVLSGIPNVISVYPERMTEQGNWRYRIAHEVKSDIRANVFKAIRNTDFVLVYLAPQEVSLESLYLQITREQEGV